MHFHHASDARFEWSIDIMQVNMGKRLESQADAQPPAACTPLTAGSFGSLFERCWQPLWCVAAAVVRDRAHADDVLQESAVIALGKLESFDPSSNFMAWMSQIVRFVGLNHVRKFKRRAPANIDPHTIESTMTSQSAIPATLMNGRGQLLAGHDSFDERVLAALDGLEETARACLLLRTLLDMPYREISLALDIPEGTAMSHVHRARASMRRRLSSITQIADHPKFSPQRNRTTDG
jgi:RNA polymerase sigma-70 factor (ECF subfamily)